MMENKNLPPITPMESYVAPNVPTLDEVYKNPAPLSKLPKRWAKNAAVVACVGILGFSTLAGCLPSSPAVGQQYSHISEVVSVTKHSTAEFDLIFRVHHGGAGGASYVVHLTEQEALGIIRTQLEAVGLSFNATPPEHISDRGEWGASIGLDLFDGERNVAISLINWENSNQSFRSRGRDFADMVAADFAEQTDIPIGVFYIPGVSLWGSLRGPHFDLEWRPDRGEPTDEEMAEIGAVAGPILVERLTDQVEEFISFLRAEGIL